MKSTNALLAATVLALSGSIALAQEEGERALRVGEVAPVLQVTEWIGSAPQTLRDLRGKVVLLDFWATWCKPCIQMYPEMRTWAEDMGPRGLVIVGVTSHSRQTPARIRRFLERQKLPWPVAIDPENRTQIEYGVSALPPTFLIDRRGILRFEHRGGGDLSEIEAKIRELLEERPPETSPSTAD